MKILKKVGWIGELCSAMLRTFPPFQRGSLEWDYVASLRDPHFCARGTVPKNLLSVGFAYYYFYCPFPFISKLLTETDNKKVERCSVLLIISSLAEGGGFEPPVRKPVRQFSKLVVSATHPSFLFFAFCAELCKSFLIFASANLVI